MTERELVVWWIKYYRNGRPYRESSRTTERGKAVGFLKKRLAEVATGDFCGPQAERIRVADLAEEMLREYRVNAEVFSTDRAEMEKPLAAFLR